MRVCINFIVLIIASSVFSQAEKTLNWLSFEQLNDSIQVQPKKVFIDFYADWCAPCIKMQKEVFTDSLIIEILNKDYYAVKMNVETKDTIYFGEQTFINERIKKRNPVHQIPLLMARQKNKPFSLPALVFLDERFQATSRYFQYLNVVQLSKILLEE